MLLEMLQACQYKNVNFAIFKAGDMLIKVKLCPI